METAIFYQFSSVFVSVQSIIPFHNKLHVESVIGVISPLGALYSETKDYRTLKLQNTDKSNNPPQNKCSATISTDFSRLAIVPKSNYQQINLQKL